MSTGAGAGQNIVVPRDNPCPGSTFYINADGTYENGYSWQYGGVSSPYYGIFVEGYESPAGETCCGIQLALTTLPGYYTGQTLDAYVWSGDDWLPQNVLSLTTGIAITPPAYWPSISFHDIEVSPAGVIGQYFVGYWPNWPGELGGWFVGADLDGFGGHPLTYIAPGIGYPTGWTDPSVIWGPTQALGIAAYAGTPPPGTQGACCHADGTCTVTGAAECEDPGDQWQGPYTDCDPNPCAQPVPVRTSSWGAIKAIFDCFP